MNTLFGPLFGTEANRILGTSLMCTHTVFVTTAFVQHWWMMNQQDSTLTWGSEVSPKYDSIWLEITYTADTVTCHHPRQYVSSPIYRHSYQYKLAVSAHRYLTDCYVPVSEVSGRQHLRLASRRKLNIPCWFHCSTFGFLSCQSDGLKLTDSFHDPAVES